VSSDGPRPGNKNDAVNVAQTRNIFNNIDWECNLVKIFRTENLGCGAAPYNAMNAVFEKEEMAIILEDDCLPDPSFFQFCETMLLKYRNNNEVMHISGTRWNEEYKIENSDHFFSHIGHVWGWATWKRAWSQYDYNIKSWNKETCKSLVRSLFKSRVISEFWTQGIGQMHNHQKNDVWDYQWQFAIFKKNGLAVVPNVNLISNIGTQGVHADNISSEYNFRKTQTWINTSENLNHVSANFDYDVYHMKQHFMKHYNLKQKIKLYLNSFL
jgi:hypothetical protein